MEGYDIRIKGFPRSMTATKIKLFVKKRTQCEVKVERTEEGIVGLVFDDVEGLQKFLDADIKMVQFGTETSELEYLDGQTTDDKNQASSASQETTHHLQRDLSDIRPIPRPRQHSLPTDTSQLQDAHSVEKYNKPLLATPRQQLPSRNRSAADVRKDGDVWRKRLYVGNIPAFLHQYPAFRFHFHGFGQLEKCYLHPKKLYAYVTYCDHSDALKALRNGSQVAPDAFLNIVWADPDPDNEDRPVTSHPRGPRHSNPSQPYGPYRDDASNFGRRRNRYPDRAYANPPQRYPRPALPRASSAVDLSRGRYPPEMAGGDRYEGNRQNYPSDEPMPLMAIPVENPSVNPQSASGKSRPRPKGKKKPQAEATSHDNVEPSLHLQTVCSWSDLKELPAPGGSKCVLAQNIDPSMHIQTIKMHFESNKRSGGGPVKTNGIIRMTDGLLVAFVNEKDCDSCAKTANQKIDGTDLKVFEKTIPTYYKRKFTIQGVGKSTTEDVLKMFLERWSKDETSPISCVRHPDSGVYLVDYDADFDTTETDSLLAKVSSEPLEGNKLEAARLLHSDCLKISDIPANTSDDEIRLIFESRKRTDGGPVTKVDRRKDGSSALVYFANFQDAERIYKRYKKPCIEVVLIKETPVTVDIYHHALSKDHKMKSKTKKSKQAKEKADDAIKAISSGPEGTVNSIQMTPTCDEKVFFFIKDSKTHYKLLRDSFQDLGRVDLCNTAKDGRVVKFYPEQKQGSQDEFDGKCKTLFNNFVKDYATESKTFDKEKLEKARKLKMHSHLEKMSNKKSDDDFVVRWQNNKVEVTGRKDAVAKMMVDIENAVEYKTVEIPMDEEGYRAMVYCGIVEDLRRKFPKASFNCDEKNHSVSINGPEGDATNIQLQALTMHSSVKSRKIAGLDECARRYLIDNAKISHGTIQDHITGKSIKAEFGVDEDELYLKSRNEAEHKKALAVLKEMVAVETMKTDGAKADVLKSADFKRFQQETRKKSNFGIYLKPDNSIVMVGLQADIRTLRTRIDTFLDEYAIQKKVVPLLYGKALFILERSREFRTENPKRQAVTCGLTPEHGGGIFLEGVKKNIEEAHSEINNALALIVEEKHSKRHPGIKNYYMKLEGKAVLESTSRLKNCIILAGSPNCPEWERANLERPPIVTNRAGTSVDIQREQLISAQLGGVTLSVWKVNIIHHGCDVIINTSNKELTLLPGGVSGVIKKLDAKNANRIQQEMRKIIQENYGHLSPGDAVLTGAGNLPNCNKIVHVVGPRWNVESERSNKPDLVVKSCVRGSLEQTEKAKLRSIAIPAISCGVFGGQPKICVPLILDAVRDYFQQNSTSCVTRVDFVELSNDNVLNEFKNAVAQVGGATSANQIPKIAPKPAPRSTPLFPTQKSNVTLVYGDITQQNVNVIVNIMAPNHVQQMSRGSAIAQAVASAAGARVVNECARHHGMHNMGDVFSTCPGSLACNEIFHGLIGTCAPNSKTGIKSVVQQSLQLAARGNYSSIAFPAIGTGGFRHPPDKVARWMRQEIQKHAANNLQVTIVLHPSNPNVSAAFQTEFNGTPRPSSGFSTGATYGPLSVSVLQGDITQQQTDAIVNSTNSKFDLTQGMISTVILRKGGSGIQAELQNASGDIAVTSGGNLRCRHILHLVTPRDEKDLQKKIINLLKQADAMNLSSIAIPALGTGNIQMDSGTVGLLFRSAIDTFVKLHPSTQSLNTVDIVVFDTTMVQDFKDGILGDVSAKKGVLNKFKKAIEGVVGLFSSPSKREEEILDLYFYAASRRDIQNALQCIDDETDKVMHKETIDDPALQAVTARETFEIEQTEKTHDVKIENKSDMYLTRLLVIGQTKNVMKACDAIRGVLRALSEARTTVQYVAWEKKASNGVWVELPARAAHALEKAFRGKNLGRVQVVEFQYDKVLKQTYDLANLDSPNSHIRRRLKEKGESDALPKSWDNMGSKGLKKVPLAQGSTEYNKVLNSMTTTGLSPNNPTISRIQSVALYKQYAAKKAEVTGKLQGTGHQVERQLFHGTGNADAIINNGFDRSFAGSHAAAYGNGVYFATTARYSNGFSQPGANNIRTMFLADVITGSYAQGQSGMRTPPARNGVDLYDSVVDNVSAPTMYIIFKDASAYPTYLIEYT